MLLLLFCFCDAAGSFLQRLASRPATEGHVGCQFMFLLGTPLPGGPASRAPPAQALVFAFFFALPLAFPFFGADAFQKPGSLRSFLRCDLRAPPRRQPARPRAPGIGGGVVVVVVVCVWGPYQSQ